MKEITQKDIEKVKCELAKKRKEFDELTFTDLEEQLKWIREFFNEYIPELEKRFLSEKELKEWKFCLMNLEFIFIYISQNMD